MKWHKDFRVQFLSVVMTPSCDMSLHYALVKGIGTRTEYSTDDLLQCISIVIVYHYR